MATAALRKTTPAPPVLSVPSIEDIQAWIERGENEHFTVEMLISPAVAELLLTCNKDNRPVRQKGPSRTVDSYSLAMSRGEWQMNGESIIISKEGLLNDGQHRLMAIVQSECTVPVQITFGVERTSRDTVDQGAARTPGDVLSLAGEKNHNVLAHALQMIWSYESSPTFHARPSPAQLQDTLKLHPGIRENLMVGATLASNWRLSKGAIAAAYYLCQRFRPVEAEAFAKLVVDGIGIETEDHPAHRLRRRFQEHAVKRNKLDAIEQAALFIKAFNYYRAEKNIKTLRWQRSGEGADTFPRVST